jgi:hypothetical protein
MEDILQRETCFHRLLAGYHYGAGLDPSIFVVLVVSDIFPLNLNMPSLYNLVGFFSLT